MALLCEPTPAISVSSRSRKTASGCDNSNPHVIGKISGISRDFGSKVADLSLGVPVDSRACGEISQLKEMGIVSLPELRKMARRSGDGGLSSPVVSVVSQGRIIN